MRSNQLSYRPVETNDCTARGTERKPSRTAAGASLPFGERQLDATGERRADVVEHRAEGREDRDEHDVRGRHEGAEADEAALGQQRPAAVHVGDRLVDAV